MPTSLPTRGIGDEHHCHDRVVIAVNNRIAARAPIHPGKAGHRIAAAVPPVTRQPVGTGAVDAAGCRHTSPLDVAPERALPGSCDRLCPDGDHRRKAAEMKSSDPVDYRNPPRLPKSATATEIRHGYRNPPRPIPGWRMGHLDPRTAGVRKQLQSCPDVPIAARTDIANPCSADRLRQDRAHRSHRGAHPQ